MELAQRFVFVIHAVGFGGDGGGDRGAEMFWVWVWGLERWDGGLGGGFCRGGGGGEVEGERVEGGRSGSGVVSGGRFDRLEVVGVWWFGKTVEG